MSGLRFVLSSFVLCLSASLACSQDSITSIKDLEEYEKQVNAMLKTRLTAEKEYVAAIFELVEDGDVPRDLVDRSVLWVQSKRQYSHRPFVYFARVLELLGERADVEIPPFDYNVYSNKTP